MALYNSTYIPFDDPLSVTNASLVITLLSTETRPLIGQPYYEAELVEQSAVNTQVPGLEILVTSTNVVCRVVLTEITPLRYDTIRYIICTEKLTGKLIAELFNLAHELKEN